MTDMRSTGKQSDEDTKLSGMVTGRQLRPDERASLGYLDWSHRSQLPAAPVAAHRLPAAMVEIMQDRVGLFDFKASKRLLDRVLPVILGFID